MLFAIFICISLLFKPKTDNQTKKVAFQPRDQKRMRGATTFSSDCKPRERGKITRTERRLRTPPQTQATIVSHHSHFYSNYYDNIDNNYNLLVFFVKLTNH